jgi:type VI secretion system secreted protein VgrG
MAKAHTVLELTAGSLAASDVRVTRVRGREALSEPFLFEVDFEPVSGDPLELADLVGAEAQLVLRSDASERFVCGLAEAVTLTSVRKKRARYRLRLVPRLALLGHAADSRIFQSQSVNEIAKAVLDEWGVKHAWDLSASYPKRGYCTQYRETDLAFVSRLLEEEGIGYRFDCAEGEHTMALFDDPGAFPAIPGEAALPFRDPDRADATGEEHVHATVRSGSLRTGKATLRDFDFVRPGLAILESAKAPKDADLEAYGYHLAYADPGPLKRLAKVRLEEARVAADGTEGRSSSFRLAPGRTFEIEDAPADALGGKLQLLWVVHDASWAEGSDSAEYACLFGAQVAGTPWRPPRRTPRSAIPGAQTATVVGPQGEEIHTDRHGRIKVQFHWDRQGKKDEKASCFVRVAQPWAGAGWGASRLPRIGQEVLVRFLEGDPDQPLVAGAVYNGALPPPIALPGDKTQSTLRSDSSPGGGGFNELRFEDAQGSEQVFWHAQHDETIVVENDKRQEVHANEALEVDGDRKRTVGQNQRLSVGADDDTAVSGDQKLAVAAVRKTQTGMSHSEKVSGSQSVTVGRKASVEVGQASAVTVGAAAALTVGGAYLVNVGGVLNIGVGGARLEQVGGARLAAVGAEVDVQVKKKAEAKIGGEDSAAVAGKVEQVTDKDVEEKIDGKGSLGVVEPAALLAKSFQLEAQKKLTIAVGGKVLLEMQSSGQVGLNGKAITVEGSGQITTKGSKIEKTAGSGPPSAGGSPAPKDEKEKPGKAEASFSTAKAEPGADVTLDVKLTDVPDGKKGLVTVHHAASGALVPGGKFECESKGGKLVDKKTGKAPVIQFGSKQLPWDPWDKPFFFFKASVEYQGLAVETPADVKDGGKSLKVKYHHVCLGDGWADAGGLTTGAEAAEIAAILGGVPDSKADTKQMSVPSPTFADWAPSLKGTYAYHHGSHGTCQDRVTGAFISTRPPPKGFGDPPACPVGNWRSVVILSKQAKFQYLVLGDTELRDKAKFPEVPRYLAYLDCCLAGWEPSLGRAFVARGTQYVIAFRRTIPDNDARQMARKFHKKWAQTHKLDPGKIRDLFFEVGAPFYKSMRPVLVSWRYEPIQAPDANVVERAIAAIGAVVEGIANAIGSLFK